VRQETFGSFGAMLRYLRKRSRRPQREIAAALGVSQSTLSGWERLADAPNDPFVIGVLAELFSVPSENLAARSLLVPDAAADPVSMPYEALCEFIEGRIKPEELPALSELVREWADWSPRVRDFVVDAGRISSGGERQRRGKSK
jgi:transcriptional regulator with XRE-family HTH domain